MKIKLGVLVSSVEPLGKLMQHPMPAATAFRCSKVLKTVQTELESYEEARKKLIEEHGEDGEITPESKSWDSFVIDMNKLLEEEVKIDIKTIKSETLSKVEIAPADLLVLEWLIKE